MAKQKYHYYVGIHTSKGVQLVTKIGNATKVAHWNTDDKPLEMSQTMATDLAYCLCLNWYTAFVIKSLFELNGHPVAFEVKDGE